jgi:hypothetical protein
MVQGKQTRATKTKKQSHSNKFTSRKSKLDGVVHHSALGATRKIDVGIVGVNVSAPPAAINAILTFGGFKPTSPQFSVDSDGG